MSPQALISDYSYLIHLCSLARPENQMLGSEGECIQATSNTKFPSHPVGVGQKDQKAVVLPSLNLWENIRLCCLEALDRIPDWQNWDQCRAGASWEEDGEPGGE